MSEKPNWRVRPVELSDTEIVARIHVESWKVAYHGLMPSEVLDDLTVQQHYKIWKNHIMKGRRGLVLEREQGVEGFCMYGPSKNREHGEIYAIHLDPSVWKLGGGSELYCETTSALREMGFSDIEVRVLEGNEIACGFYRKHGLTSNGTIHNVRVAGLDLPHIFFHGKL
jgi:ribosomal protein S18 acetylase RimI-like enzyme